MFLRSNLISFTGTKSPSEMDKDDPEVEMYKRHNNYFEVTKVIGISALLNQNFLKVQDVDVQRDIHLFIARYSGHFKIGSTCDGCLEKIRGRWYKCLHCINIDLCTNCQSNGRKPRKHLDSHEVTELR